MSGNQIGRSFPCTELGHRLFKLKNRLQVHIDIANSNGKLQDVYAFDFIVSLFSSSEKSY